MTLEAEAIFSPEPSISAGLSPDLIEPVLDVAGRREIDLAETFDLLLAPLPNPSLMDRIKRRPSDHIVVLGSAVIELIHERSGKTPGLLIQRGRDVVFVDRVGELGIRRSVLAVSPRLKATSAAYVRQLELEEKEAAIGIMRDHDDQDLITENLQRVDLLMMLTHEEEQALEEERLRIASRETNEEIGLFLDTEVELA